jgi:hypothetical protein
MALARISYNISISSLILSYILSFLPYLVATRVNRTFILATVLPLNTQAINLACLKQSADVQRSLPDNSFNRVCCGYGKGCGSEKGKDSNKLHLGDCLDLAIIDTGRRLVLNIGL